MRISDWSSDVCSSDLSHEPAGSSERHAFRFRNRTCAGVKGLAARETIWPLRHRFGLARQAVVMGVDILGAEQYRYRERKYRLRMPQPRSEEHTSELQSLMRISYAVFCLKKKTSSKNFTTLHFPSLLLNHLSNLLLY